MRTSAAPRRIWRAPRTLAALALALGALAGCGGGDDRPGLGAASGAAVTQPSLGPVATTRVEVVQQLARGRFDPTAVYAREAAGVVTVISLFDSGEGAPGGGGEGLGSGFVVDDQGRIATNAHVVTNGSGERLRQASTVYVQFGDGNQVPARIVGTDLNADIALISVEPTGLTLRPLPLGTSRGVVVGAPVAAIGSPFGEPQSLSVGVISATNRTIDSLNSSGRGGDGAFAISGAIQTDAAINHGNSGGPLVDAQGRVIGVNAQIQSTGGGGEGVGFAIPIDTVRRSLTQLQEHGSVAYAWIGVTTVPVFPQLARRFGLPAEQGALVQSVAEGSPAAQAGLRAGTERDVAFQASRYTIGGDVVTKVDGIPITHEYDLASAIATRSPGDVIELEVWRDGEWEHVRVTLGQRPD